MARGRVSLLSNCTLVPSFATSMKPLFELGVDIQPRAAAVASTETNVSTVAIPAPVATAQATNAGAKYLPELRESVMEFQPCSLC